MDPIMQKGGLTPDQKLRRGMYECLEKREKNPKQVNIIGNDLALQPDCEMLGLLRARGYTVKDLTTCESFEEYLSMAESFLNIVTYPPAKVAGEALSKRLDMEFLYLPQTFDYDAVLVIVLVYGFGFETELRVSVQASGAAYVQLAFSL